MTFAYPWVGPGVPACLCGKKKAPVKAGRQSQWRMRPSRSLPLGARASTNPAQDRKGLLMFVSRCSKIDPRRVGPCYSRMDSRMDYGASHPSSPQRYTRLPQDMSPRLEIYNETSARLQRLIFLVSHHHQQQQQVHLINLIIFSSLLQAVPLSILLTHPTSSHFYSALAFYINKQTKSNPPFF